MADSSAFPPLTRRAGLYLHVPFCARKCSYCSFHSRPPRQGDFARYLDAVLAHLRGVAGLPAVQALQFATVFFGGGTPSLLPAEMLATILREARQILAFADNAGEPEISLEANPGTVDVQALTTLRRAGFNRISLGVQSFDDAELAHLGRIHSAEEAKAAVRMARQAGFAQINLDLMYGLPGQTEAAWRANLDAALSLGVEHLSLYELTPEEGTALFEGIQRGSLQLPAEETVLAMMATTRELIGKSPLARYEISNYACANCACCHNINYWENGFYLGLGPGAVSFPGGSRLRIPPGLSRYHERATSGLPVWESEGCLDAEARFRETVIMGLRMTKGVSAPALQSRFGLDLREYYGARLERLIQHKFLVWQGEHLALTESGLALANPVMAELV